MSLRADLIRIARSLLARPPELRGPFRINEDRLKQVAEMPAIETVYRYNALTGFKIYRP